MNVLLKKVSFHVILPLFIGLIIYLIARPETWIVQKLLQLSSLSRECKLDISSARGVPKFFVFSGTDFCWSYSLISALFLWKHHSGIVLPFFWLLVFLLVLLQEFIQLLFPVSFTFDILDIVAAVSAFLLSFYLNRKYV